MSTDYYPQDLIGYGANPPQFHWPNQSRLAINFVINYEEGAEQNSVNGDEHAETYLAEIPRPQLEPKQRDLFVESIFEYGSRAGIWRLYSLFNEFNIKTTVFTAGLAAQKNPQIIKSFADKGHEVAGHGFRWIDYRTIPEAIEREHIQHTLKIVQDITGKKTQGWYTGRKSLNTRKIIIENGLLYDSDSYSDDLPYWITVDKKSHLIIPYTFDCNDAKYAMSPGWMSGDDFYEYLKATFTCLYREGKNHPKMMTIGLHSRISGRPGRAQAIYRFLEFIQQYPETWICTREEIANFWHTQKKENI